MLEYSDVKDIKFKNNKLVQKISGNRVMQIKFMPSEGNKKITEDGEFIVDWDTDDVYKPIVKVSSNVFVDKVNSILENSTTGEVFLELQDYLFKDQYYLYSVLITNNNIINKYDILKELTNIKRTGAWDKNIVERIGNGSIFIKTANFILTFTIETRDDQRECRFSKNGKYIFDNFSTVIELEDLRDMIKNNEIESIETGKEYSLIKLDKGWVEIKFKVELN